MYKVTLLKCSLRKMGWSYCYLTITPYILWQLEDDVETISKTVWLLGIYFPITTTDPLLTSSYHPAQPTPLPHIQEHMPCPSTSLG